MIWNIAPDDSWTLGALIVVGTACAIWLERSSRWGARLTAPVLALLIAMLLSNTGVMPPEAPAYDFVGNWLVPIALPLLLFHGDLVRIARKTGRLLLAFHLAAAGTIIGALLAFALFSSHIPEPAKAAGIMTASYIGGMVNFVAVSAATEPSGTMTSSLIVADNIVMAALFLVLFWMAGSPRVQRHFRARMAPDEPDAPTAAPPPTSAASAGDVLDLAISLGIAVAIAAAAMGLQRQLAAWLDPRPGDVWGTLATNKYVLITALSLAAATAAPRQLQRLRSAEPIGTFLLYLFLFCVGLPANVHSMFLPGSEGMVMYWLFAFCCVMVAANLAFVTIVGKFCGLSLEDVVLASNASVGGPPTAAAMAISKGWGPLVMPALLAGLYGYAVGTPLGILVTSWLSK